MIRINLLPVAEARAEARGRNELIIFAAGVAALAALFALAWFIQTAAIDELKQKVSLSQSRNDEIKKEVENAGEVKSRTNKLTQQLAVLADLKSKRTGPVRVLDELQAIMSLPRNEEDRFAQRERGWDVDWDPRRLWLASLSEVEVRAESPDALPGFELVGTAMSAEDVAQFMRRLSASDHFRDVELDYVKAVDVGTDRDGGVRAVEFRLTGALAYAGRAPSVPVSN